MQRRLGLFLITRVRVAHDAIAQNASQFFVAVRRRHIRLVVECFLGELQVLQSHAVIGLILGHMTVRLRLLQFLLLGVRDLRDLLILPVGLGEVAFTDISDRLLHAVGEAVCLIMSEANGLVVFHTSLFLIPHESVRVTETELRRDEVGIDLQGGTIVVERALKTVQPCA